MTTHLPSHPAAKLLLDAEAIDTDALADRSRADRAERRSRALALVGIHTRGVPLAARLRAVSSPSGAGWSSPLGALDITFHRDDVLVRNGGAPLHTQPVVHGTALDFPLAGQDRRAGRRRPLHGPDDSGRDRGAPRVRPARSASSSRFSSTAAIASCPIRPDFVGKNLPTARDGARTGAAARGGRGGCGVADPRPRRRRRHD